MQQGAAHSLSVCTKEQPVTPGEDRGHLMENCLQGLVNPEKGEVGVHLGRGKVKRALGWGR